MRHRKLCLGQICDGNFDEIAGYFEKFLVQRWPEQDFSEGFDCFWHKFHQIISKYPDMSSLIWQNFFSKTAPTVTTFYIELRLVYKKGAPHSRLPLINNNYY